MARIQSLISFLVLAVASIYCFYDYYSRKKMEYEFPHLIYLFTAAYGLIGIIINLRNSSNNKLWKWLYNTEVFIKTISFPCFVTEVWLKYGVIKQDTAWIRTVLGAIPAAIFVFDERLKKNWIDVIIYLTVLSLVAVYLQNPNVWGLTATGTFLAGYYILRENKCPLHIAPEIWFNYFTAAFACSSLIAINP